MCKLRSAVQKLFDFEFNTNNESVFKDLRSTITYIDMEIKKFEINCPISSKIANIKLKVAFNFDSSTSIGHNESELFSAVIEDFRNKSQIISNNSSNKFDIDGVGNNRINHEMLNINSEFRKMNKTNSDILKNEEILEIFTKAS